MIRQLLTPCFILNKSELTNNLENMHKALNDTWGNYIIGYSYKTNSLPWIINFVKIKGCYAEVVSDSEYRLAKKIGYEEGSIIYNGPNKGKPTFINALKGNSIVNIDSNREIGWLKEEEFENIVNVGIRVNFNLEKECPNETAMGSEGSRFGFSLENGDFEKAINEINKIKNVKVSGIHLHNSSKTRSLKIYEVLSRKACEISSLFDYQLDYIDIGGGFFGGLEGKPSYYDYMKLISEELSKAFDKNKTKLVVEPGASLISSPISFLCEVVDVKDIFDNRIVTINGSRNNIDPLMMKTNYFYNIFTKNNNLLKKQVICGYTCMENDRLMKLINQQELSIGDKILFNKVGAYTMCLSPLFIEYFPRIYLEDVNGEYKCIRESWDVEEYVQKSFI